MAQKPYDHRRYAGNQGDLWKHFGLLTVLAALRPRHYGETHGGPGGVLLAERGEWERGLGRLLRASAPALLDPAIARVRETGIYPGSWSQASACADRVTACELCPDAFARAAAHRATLAGRIELRQEDGFVALDGVLADCDLVLIDPPYTRADGQPHDWDRVHDAVAMLRRRGTAFLVWYPVFWISNPTRLVEGAGLPGYELIWREFEDSRPGHDSKGAGLLAGGAAAAVLAAAQESLAACAVQLGGRLAIRSPHAFAGRDAARAASSDGARVDSGRR